MTAGRSAHEWAAQARAHARRGVWRRVLSWMGVTVHTRRADAVAARRSHGAAGEEATAQILAGLEAQGWHVRHDLMLRGRRFNLDHVLVSPCGTALVVVDTKAWDRGRTTSLVRGRVHCGIEGRQSRVDRHEEVQKLAGYARLVAQAVGLEPESVWPLLVVHGSPVAGCALEVPVRGGTVFLLGPERVLPTLEAAPAGRDPMAAAALAARVDQVLLPYVRPPSG